MVIMVIMKIVKIVIMKIVVIKIDKNQEIVEEPKKLVKDSIYNLGKVDLDLYENGDMEDINHDLNLQN